MRHIHCIATLVLVAGVAACNNASLAPVARAADDPAAACTGCHSGKRGFSGQDADELAARIRAIIAGDARHPPLELDDTSNAAIDELAADLVER